MQRAAVAILIFGFFVTLWFLPGKPPELVVKGRELDGYSFETASPGDWVLYEDSIGLENQLPAHGGRVLLVARDEKGCLVETEGIFWTKPGLIVTVRIPRNSLDIERAWIGRTGETGVLATIVKDEDWREPKRGPVEFRSNRSEMPTGSFDLDSVLFRGSPLRCLKVAESWSSPARPRQAFDRQAFDWKTPLGKADFLLSTIAHDRLLTTSGPKFSRAWWWAPEVPELRPHPVRTEKGDIAWSATMPDFSGGLLKFKDSVEGISVEWVLLDCGRGASPSLRVNE